MAVVPREHMFREDVQWILSMETVYQSKSFLRVNHGILIAVAQPAKHLIKSFKSKCKENQLASSVCDATLCVLV